MMDFSHACMHILGHPELPLLPEEHPADAQVLNCWNFCLLLEHLGIPYRYYGLEGSRVPAGGLGRVVSCGRATCRWRYRNSWHGIYSRRLDRRLGRELPSGGAPQWVASLYGIAQSDVHVPEGIPVFEPMVGYDHCWTPFRVFPSYAQQHVIYARQPEHTARNRFFDAVIPHFLDSAQFHVSDSPGGYLLYLGRRASGKGIGIARRCAEQCGRELKCIHQGCRGREKADLLAGAYAVLMPTLYVEPFGYVAIEAQICGTPVVCTDWGAFTETVLQGITGFRCRVDAEFRSALERCAGLDRRRIAAIARERFTISAVAPKYRDYLELIWKVCNSGGYYARDAALDRRTFLEERFPADP